MKQIELISVGELKFKALKEMEKLYSEKINHFIPFNSKIIRDVKINDEIQKKKKEGEQMLQLLDTKNHIIALDQYGKKMDSPKFAHLISEQLSYGPDKLVFLIGGHSGLSGELDNFIHLKISFSDMTFAHDIFRILFLEQLYRAFTIIKGTAYHR